ncbi:hypothetical protein SAMN05660461_0365 [Chitinophaga ginsengisegetis]|uniref:PXPV repeat-containing protein n=1 Tax=Chitinophaga ginsengisegetis TaxID=393003 RepID=A0A1T5N4W9_9BACT|nr:hypothetical protein [Chitinophaga ginsengisegetis]SKC95384.1 hypothetical protein SAMN05660461_0365 [Chitinophaga ginsengisegetis]
MKKVLLLMLLIGGTVLTTYAQRGYDRGHGRGHGYGHGRGYDRYDDDRWERCERPRRVYVRDRYDDCYRPQRVVYARPAYYPAVIPVPVPAPVRYYPSRPRAVFHAGVTIVN